MEKNNNQKIITITIGVFAFLIISLSIGLMVYAKDYKDKVLPGVYIGGTPLGGMDKGEVEGFLQNMNNKLSSQGVLVEYQKNDSEHTFTLNPIVVVGENGGNTIDLVSINIEKNAEKIVNYGKGKNVFDLTLATIDGLLSKKNIELKSIDINSDRVKEILKENISSSNQEPINSDISITKVNPVEYKITTSSPGIVYDYDSAISDIRTQLSQLKMPEIQVDSQRKEPDIKEEDLEDLTPKLDQILSGDITLTFEGDYRDFGWGLEPSNFSKWIGVEKKEDKLVFGLDKEGVNTFIKENISEDIEREAQSAKFELKEDGKVRKFIPAKTGRKVDIQSTHSSLNQVISNRFKKEKVSSTVSLVIEEVEPEVKTHEANDLGIKEKIDTGVSDFSGSPANRIHNISIGVEKLDGLLIPPGETFSAVESTKPYTKAAGYLPELVIKGEKIKPEIGGGLCQIGTTLFRMAMESGMPIEQRRNHSLVVNYYVDPVNGLPGTDATLYNPNPDFKFKNDTDSHMMIQAEMDRQDQKLYFSLWGQDDGRSSSTYTHPQVSEWFEPGKTKYKKTTDLAPGETKCQKAHRGANSSFTYKKTLPSGTTTERVFSSYYRPLPKICLVGIKKEEYCADLNKEQRKNDPKCKGVEIGEKAEEEKDQQEQVQNPTTSTKKTE